MAKLGGSRGRMLRRAFSRERLLAFVRALIWVAPLTVLIWVYAEREQISLVPDVSVPIRVRAGSESRIATFPGFAVQTTVTVELEGPRVRLDALRQQLMSGLSQGGLIIDIDPGTPIGQLTRRTADLLNTEVPLFKSAGVKVVAANPQQITLQVDEMITREFIVVAEVPASSNTTLETAPIFDPPVVKMSGPRPLIDRMTTLDVQNRPIIKAELIRASNATEILRTAGVHELPDVPLIRPHPPGTDDNSLGQVRLSAERVKATVRVRHADVSFTIPAMPVFAVAAGSFLDDYRPVFEPTITNVVVQGSPEVIAALKSNALPRKPKALLELGRDDLPPGRTVTRKLRFDLPEGLTVSPDDENREIEFTLVARAKGE